MKWVVIISFVVAVMNGVDGQGRIHFRHHGRLLRKGVDELWVDADGNTQMSSKVENCSRVSLTTTNTGQRKSSIVPGEKLASLNLITKYFPLLPPVHCPDPFSSHTRSSSPFIPLFRPGDGVVRCGKMCL
jgi:hypothetical protein